MNCYRGDKRDFRPFVVADRVHFGSLADTKAWIRDVRFYP